MSELKDKLFYKSKNVYDTATEEEIKAIYDYSQGYKKFLDCAKTERDAVITAIQMAEKEGFREYKMGDDVKQGGRYYCNNRGKSLYLFTIGKKPLEEGMRISAAHIDSPRVDLKQNPLYDDGEMGFFKTHYYGGIKKYQWTAIPLALHGVVIRADGSKVDVCVGEDDGDPVFYINDLLPHLAQDQMSKKMSEAVSGESLNILIGSVPEKDGENSSIKLHIMKLLNEKYGITEEDFISAELTGVPAGRSRDVGFDRSLIMGYGHDDKCCAYPALTAIFENPEPQYTLLTILADKEEVGSMGNTGMRSRFFVDLISSLSKKLGADENVVRLNSKCLSADVNSAFDPNYAEVFEKRNSSYINHGVVMTKFTGARGKSGTSDASAEYVGFVRRLFDEKGIVWQTGELGKVDAGGGGTVAMFIADHNIDTVDLGVAVISMHAPYEVISKADIYMTHRAFSAFNE